jgi:Cu/Ag efflux pump CusA
MRAIVAWSLRFRLLVLGIAAAALLFGYTQLSRASVDTLPEFGPAYVEVQTEALGLSAEEVEQLITVPLEADLLHGVAFLDEIHSQSVAGLSSIVMFFEPGTEVLRARQMVAERLTQAHALPNVSKSPAMLQPLSSSSRVLMVGMSSNDVSLINMSVLARWTIRPRLLSVPGVANVAIWGQRERQLQVQVDPVRLRERGVSLSQVIETAGNALWVSPLTFLDASTPGTGGFIDTPNQRLGIQHVLPISTPEELAKVAIVRDRPLANVPHLTLGDVATIVEDHQPLIGDAVVNDGPGLVLVIEKFPDASTLDVTRDVEAALAALQPGLSGIEVDSSLFRPATYLETATSNVALALVIALLLIVVVIGVVLNHWRAALISLVVIPLSLAAGGLILLLTGASFNALVLAGMVLAIGILVDDAVVAFSAIDERSRQLRAEDRDRSVASAILEATLEARGPMVYATLIVGCAIVPLLLAGGVAGAFWPAMAVAFAIAVLASMLVALTVTPALCLLIGTDTRATRRESALAQRIRLRYTQALTRFVGRTRTAVVLVGAAAIAAVVLFGAGVVPRVAQAPLPAFRDSELLIHWNAAVGTSRPEMDRIVGLVSKELRGVPGVRDVGGHVGRAILSDQVVGIDSGELWLSLDPASDYDTTVAAVRKVVKGYPGFQTDIRTYASDRVAAALPPANSDLVVRVYGQELDVLQQQADQVRQAVAGVPNVATAQISGQTEEATLKIQVDLTAADKFGLKPGDVRRSATTLLSGIVVGSLFEDQKVFEVVVWSVPGIRQDLSAVNDLPIDTPGGRHVRLGDVASVAVAPSPSVIRREGVFRYLDIAINVSGGDLATTARNINTAAKSVAMPLEYRAEVLGSYSDQLATDTRMLTAGIAAAIVIFLLLQAAFQSWRLAAMVFVTLPAAVVGGALAAVALGGGQSLGALFGFITVLAITARSGILLVREFQRLQREGDLAGRALVLHAASERLTPLLATVGATMLAFSPFVLLGERPGFEVIRPMAVVILGGLVTSTLLLLFIVPSMYERLAASPQGDQETQLVPDQPAFEPSIA